MVICSFVFSLIVFVAIGVASGLRRHPSTEDYLLASQDVKPWLVGLSFFATENSGFMFIGYVGLVYLQGVSAVWFLVGWYSGEASILWFTARKLRDSTAELNAQTYSALLSRWGGREITAIRRLSALIIIVFLGIYAAAQLSAGGKALNVLLGWDYGLGAVIGFVVVVLYCFAGGIRASIWTDAVQGVVMLISLIVLVAAGLSRVGGYHELWSQLSAVDQSLTRPFPSDLRFGFLAYFAGWLFAGMGVLGQPHVMVRFMVIDRPQNVRRALMYYVGMVSVLTFLCLTVGLVARAVLPELLSGDPELALPKLSSVLLPDMLTGLVLAGLFAASVSTADSQVLSSAAALTQDLVPRYANSYGFAKIGTLLVGSVALVVALLGLTNVFGLVTFAWATMGAGFAPLLFLYTVGAKPGARTALTMMIAGPVASILWKLYGYPDDIYSVLPGVLAALGAYAVCLALPARHGRSRAQGEDQQEAPHR